MTPEQQEYFLRALWSLIDASASGRVTAQQMRSGLLLLWMAQSTNGYLNLSHIEAGFVCYTKSNDTMRAHLIALCKANVLNDYSTNGTVRIKFSSYPGREMITPRRQRSSSPDEQSSSPDEQSSSPDEQSSSPDEQLSDNDRCNCSSDARHRALHELLRASHKHHSRNFDGFAQKTPSMLVSQLDLTDPSETGTNKLTATPETTIDPVEEARSVSFLLDAGVWMKTAKQLAKIHPFELLRRAVGLWWANRRSLGGELDERPGIVIAWLTNLEETTIPATLPGEFMASSLYLRHRTPAERAAEVTTVTDDASTPGDEIEYALDEDLWSEVYAALQLPEMSRRMWFAGARLWRAGANFRLALDIFQANQVQNQFRPMLRRTLAQATGLAMSEISLEVCSHDSIER